ncbi:peptidyl-alpha-hydroxyglycine alpha-amidating lyase family protein [Microbulbifer sp. OS29]|uniref:Peptidyl-alpha-hydroxyglycine alpha-amidating lyase family protein n=1 Tax=Microbulbifer okhotskensis TaxID=2926617 RepID=A0A9X2J920_9GAMM|nr:peptidyl-alpha-hydroxyglycine alpha-amidating lyase family protein [Microbulbifer okhotskensis]MCO1336166.1 peptidyl-alpha-hydroxyglycine alpha-amidating lyase family protein [Microbulbifer okhotskensis]
MRVSKLLCLLLFPCVAALADIPSDSAAFNIESGGFELPDTWQFGEVAGVYRTKSKHFIVLHRGAHSLLEFDSQRRFVREIGAGLFENPHGLRVDQQGNIWTTDTATHLVLKFTPSGEVAMVLGKRGAASAGWFDRDYNLVLFNQPQDVAVDADGYIYVVDKGNSRIVKLDENGLLVKIWGSQGSAPGEFNFPHSIVIDSEGKLYIADRENQRVQVFDSNGAYLSQWKEVGYPYVLMLDGQTLWMTDARTEEVRQYDLFGNLQLRYRGEPGRGAKQFGFVHGLYVDTDGLWVSHILNWKISHLQPVNVLPAPAM